MTTIKVKRARLPRCPNISDIRADFRQMNERIRAARHEYIAKCFEASLHLSGKALARFISKVAGKMQDNGLYSPTTYMGDIAWSVARWFGRLEVGSDYWKRNRWWDYRGLTQPIMYEMRKRVGRGRRREEAVA